MTTADFCTDPSAITDEQIIAFALGEAGSQTRRHIDQCAHCRAEAQSYERLMKTLLQGAHPATIKLGELAMHMLSAQEELVIQAHVRSCASCQAETASLREFLATDANPVAAGIASALRRIIARPQAPLAPALGGLRSSGPDESRTYEAEEEMFVIGVERRQAGRAGRDLNGMQVPPPASASSAALYDESGRLLQTKDLNEIGGFLFDGVRAGKYQVEVTSETRIVVIESVEVA